MSGTFRATPTIYGRRSIFSGPDYLRDYRKYVQPDHRYIGNTTISRELNNDVNGLLRAGPNAQFPRPTSKSAGGIGWGATRFTGFSTATGEQIFLGEHRQALEDKYSHRLQNPRDTYKRLSIVAEMMDER